MSAKYKGEIPIYLSLEELKLTLLAVVTFLISREAKPTPEFRERMEELRDKYVTIANEAQS